MCLCMEHCLHLRLFLHSFIVLLHLLRLLFMTRGGWDVNYSHRHGVKDRIYPAVSPAKGDEVYGKVLFDLTEWELEVFDLFEDIEYTRVVTAPILLGKTTMETAIEQVPIGMNGQDVADAGIENVAKVGTATHDSLQAYIYVWASDVELVGDWDYETWRRIHLEEYVKMCEEFASQLPKHPEE